MITQKDSSQEKGNTIAWIIIGAVVVLMFIALAFI